MQVWPYQESDYFESALQTDLHLLLRSFYTTHTPSSISSHPSATAPTIISLTFSSFKRSYKDLFFHELHTFCPLRIDEEIFFQQIIRHILFLFHHPAPDLFPSFPLELRQALWNIGIFFLLYCFYGTRCVKNHHKIFRIRVSPEEWYEIILAYQRLKSLGNIGLQAIKVFHKLQADSAFHYSSYSGGPSLYRVSKMIEDIRLRGKDLSRSDFPQYLQQIVEGNIFISSHCEEMRSLVINDMSNSPYRFIFSSSSTPLDALLLASADTSLPHAVNMDQSMKEFFGISDGENSNSHAAHLEESSEEDNPLETQIASTKVSEGQSSTLSLLEQLERETNEVLGGVDHRLESERTTVTKKVRANSTQVRRKKPQSAPSRGKRSPRNNEEGVTPENDPLRLLEQLEKGSMELLGAESTVRGGKGRKKSETVKTKRSSKIDTKEIPSEILMRLEAEVSEVLENVAAPKTAAKERQRKKPNETKKVRRESTRKKTSDDKHSSANDTLSLLEQLERETMEVLSGSEL